MVDLEQQEYRTALGTRVTVVPISIFDQATPFNDPSVLLAGYDALILGGSGEFDLDGGRSPDDEARRIGGEVRDRLRALVAFVIESDFPTFGVCFGHQIIADLRGGNVMNDQAQSKMGTHSVQLTDMGHTDILFSRMPDSFLAQYGHKDSVTVLPKGATLLAYGPQCRFSALRYGKHVYTTQFHPELTADDVKKRIERMPGYLPEDVSAGSVVQASPEASRLLGFFTEQAPHEG